MGVDTKLYFIKSKASTYHSGYDPLVNPLDLAETIKEMARDFNTGILKEIIGGPILDVDSSVLDETLTFALNSGVFPSAKYGDYSYKDPDDKTLSYVIQPFVLLDASSVSKQETIRSAFELISRYGVTPLLDANVGSSGLGVSVAKLRMLKLEQALFDKELGSSNFLHDFKFDTFNQYAPSIEQLAHCFSGNETFDGFTEDGVFKDIETYTSFTDKFSMCTVSLRKNSVTDAFLDYIRTRNPLNCVILYAKKDSDTKLDTLSDPDNVDAKKLFDSFNAVENKRKTGFRVN
jgi:hypothetical protein